MHEPGSLEDLTDLVEPWLARLCGDSVLRTILAILLLGPVVVTIATTVVVCLNLVMLGDLVAGGGAAAWRSMRRDYKARHRRATERADFGLRTATLQEPGVAQPLSEGYVVSFWQASLSTLRLSGGFMKALLAVGLIGLVLPAWGGIVSTASINQVKLKLVDLDLSDGITPAFQFNDGDRAVWVNTFARTATSDKEDYRGATQQFSTVSASVTNGTITGSAAGIGSGFNGYLLTASSGTSQSVGPANWMYFSASASAPASQGAFSMTANTAVVITAFASVSIAADVNYNGSYFTNAVSSASMSISGPGVTGNGSQFENDSLRTELNPYRDVQQSLTKSALMGVSFVNASSESMTGYFGMQVGTSGSVTPVPEPSTYALLIAGLIGSGFIARRRS